MANKIKRLGKIKAKSADGREFNIVVGVEMLDASDLSGPEFVEGDLILTTDSGAHVNLIVKGVYQIVSMGLEVRSDDPNAP